MSDYTQAPATKMLAVHCAVCSRPLLDSVSVELGIGPDCRKKYGFDVSAAPEARVAANALVAKIACVQKGEEALLACKELHGLGFVQLAARIMQRLTKVIVKVEGATLEVFAPYNGSFVLAMQQVPGRKWDPKRKCSVIPATSRAALWSALQAGFPGMWALGPRGPFVIA